MRPIRLLVVCTFFLTLAATGADGQDADLQQRINLAIQKGVDRLLQLQGADGSWPHGPRRPDGMTAIVSWTLLESGVPPADPKLKAATEYLRREALSADQTYAISLMIMFFDKLGDPADQFLIETLGVRLLQGHTGYGGWSYSCGKPDHIFVKNLEETAKQFRARPPTIVKGEVPKLHPITEAQLNVLRKRKIRPLNEINPIGIGDNSNTQFALLALWVARRHGLPVDQHLNLIRQRFELSMLPGGGWPYQPFEDPSLKTGEKPVPTGSMTCAGLLSYAVAEGTRNNGQATKQLLENPQVRDGFNFLGPFLTPKPTGSIGTGGLCYFLFSLERVAVIYELKTIADIDWYVAGAQKLIALQSKEGSWPSGHGQADTCFALLFLKRANVAWDLGPILANPIKRESRKVNPKDHFDLPMLIPKKDRP
ncbi:MAG: hypothetical protein HY040_24385 [Planctomycetes bacterium]|nr:hypothetical protein [Planctomycetota bacterium]